MVSFCGGVFQISSLTERLIWVELVDNMVFIVKKWLKELIVLFALHIFVIHILLFLNFEISLFKWD